MFGAQCVDLVRQYIKEVYEVPQPEGVIGAEDFYTKHEDRPIQKQYFNLIQYIHPRKPQSGAIVVFGATDKNKFGHIGICISADETSITLFEQDGFAQSGAKIHNWNYDRCLGWLVPKAA